MGEAGGSTIVDRVLAPRRPGPGSLRDRFWEFATRIGLGAVRGRHWELLLGPLPLLSFGDPEPWPGGWRWPIRGGLLARAPGGFLGFAWRSGELIGSVEGYRPTLPTPLYQVLQRPVHRLITRLFLLDLRGRSPLPAAPAGPLARVGAGAADLALCIAIGRLFRLSPRGTIALTAAYHLIAWTLGGQTAAAAVSGQRVVSLDGSRVTGGQALLRLLAMPVAWALVRAQHDRMAGTEVIGT